MRLLLGIGKGLLGIVESLTVVQFEKLVMVIELATACLVKREEEVEGKRKEIRACEIAVWAYIVSWTVEGVDRGRD